MKQLIRSAFHRLGFDLVRTTQADTGIHSDFTHRDREVMSQAAPFTMTSRERLYALRAAVQYITANNIPGDIVECGVWRGGSMMAAALTLKELGDESRELHLFDTFEGMPPPQQVDTRFDGVSAQALLDSREKSKEDHYWAYSPLEDVQRNLATTGYPTAKLHFTKGLVEETIPQSAPGQIALLRLDTDWYESTRHELIHLYDRVPPGGIIIIDDYGWYAGARKAVDEFIAQLEFKPLLQRIDRTGRLIVKPS